MDLYEKLSEWVNYNPSTGKFYWSKDLPYRKKGTEIKGCYRKGYHRIRVRVEGKPKHTSAHRLAFLIMSGTIPKQVDHIDGDRSNNKWNNLRASNNQTNQWNVGPRKSKSGIKNVYCIKDRNSWVVKVPTKDGRKFIGEFKNLELAELVAQEAREKYHGEFACG